MVLLGAGDGLFTRTSLAQDTGTGLSSMDLAQKPKSAGMNLAGPGAYAAMQQEPVLPSITSNHK